MKTIGGILDLLGAKIQPLEQPAGGGYHVLITKYPRYFHMTVMNLRQDRNRSSGAGYNLYVRIRRNIAEGVHFDITGQCGASYGTRSGHSIDFNTLFNKLISPRQISYQKRI